MCDTLIIPKFWYKISWWYYNFNLAVQIYWEPLLQMKEQKKKKKDKKEKKRKPRMIIDRKYSDWKGTNISQVSSRFVNQRTRSRVVRKVVRTGNGRCTAVRIDIHKESSHSSPDRGDCSLAENKSSRSRLRTTID